MATTKLVALGFVVLVSLGLSQAARVARLSTASEQGQGGSEGAGSGDASGSRAGGGTG
jgi:hypothetical protein